MDIDRVPEYASPTLADPKVSPGGAARTVGRDDVRGVNFLDNVLIEVSHIHSNAAIVLIYT
jgi:hypothetical protein